MTGTVQVAHEIATKLERAVERSSEAFIPLTELHLLCPAASAASEEFRCIAEFAAARHWSFAFLPHRVIRFAPYPATVALPLKETPFSVWSKPND
ncbi:MAG: hypothetical protein ACJ8KX_01060 [Chthoniobacterales bacterium]|jgi:hypothetical protein